MIRYWQAPAADAHVWHIEASGRTACGKPIRSWLAWSKPEPPPFRLLCRSCATTTGEAA